MTEKSWNFHTVILDITISIFHLYHQLFVYNFFSIFQFPATGISWLVYETFKHYLPLLGFGGSSNSQENDKYETLSSSKTAVMSQNFQPVQIGSRVSHLSSGGNTNTGSSAAVEDPTSSRHSFKVVTPTVVAASSS